MDPEEDTSEKNSNNKTESDIFTKEEGNNLSVDSHNIYDAPGGVTKMSSPATGLNYGDGDESAHDHETADYQQSSLKNTKNDDYDPENIYSVQSDSLNRSWTDCLSVNELKDVNTAGSYGDNEDIQPENCSQKSPVKSAEITSELTEAFLENDDVDGKESVDITNECADVTNECADDDEEDDDDITNKLRSIQVLPRIPKLKRSIDGSGTGQQTESSMTYRSVLERAEVNPSYGVFPKWPKIAKRDDDGEKSSGNVRTRWKDKPATTPDDIARRMELRKARFGLVDDKDKTAATSTPNEFSHRLEMRKARFGHSDAKTGNGVNDPKSMPVKPLFDNAWTRQRPSVVQASNQSENCKNFSKTKEQSNLLASKEKSGNNSQVPSGGCVSAKDQQEKLWSDMIKQSSKMVGQNDPAERGKKEKGVEQTKNRDRDGTSQSKQSWPLGDSVKDVKMKEKVDQRNLQTMKKHGESSTKECLKSSSFRSALPAEKISSDQNSNASQEKVTSERELMASKPTAVCVADLKRTSPPANTNTASDSQSTTSDTSSASQHHRHYRKKSLSSVAKQQDKQSSLPTLLKHPLGSLLPVLPPEGMENAMDMFEDHRPFGVRIPSPRDSAKRKPADIKPTSSLFYAPPQRIQTNLSQPVERNRLNGFPEKLLSNVSQAKTSDPLLMMPATDSACSVHPSPKNNLKATINNSESKIQQEKNELSVKAVQPSPTVSSLALSQTSVLDASGADSVTDVIDMDVSSSLSASPLSPAPAGDGSTSSTTAPNNTGRKIVTFSCPNDGKLAVANVKKKFKVPADKQELVSAYYQYHVYI